MFCLCIKLYCKCNVWSKYILICMFGSYMRNSIHIVYLKVMIIFLQFLQGVHVFQKLIFFFLSFSLYVSNRNGLIYTDLKRKFDFTLNMYCIPTPNINPIGGLFFVCFFLLRLLWHSVIQPKKIYRNVDDDDKQICMQ